ncbi:MAG: hypothetical protein R3C56_19065 [Pirellulaceae bacterium]
MVNDGIKLIFEQFRDIGGTLIAAHQTASQLRRQGTDLGDTIDSCTAMKQIFRASDLQSLERQENCLECEASCNYLAPAFERGSGDLEARFGELHAQEGMVRVSEKERARYDRNSIQAISSRRQLSLVRFTFGSGYTQFAGKSIAIKSDYHISFDQYKARRRMPWPTAPGAFVIEPPTKCAPRDVPAQAGEASGSHTSFEKEFEKRTKRRVRTKSSKPKAQP